MNSRKRKRPRPVAPGPVSIFRGPEVNLKTATTSDTPPSSSSDIVLRHGNSAQLWYREIPFEDPAVQSMVREAGVGKWHSKWASFVALRELLRLKVYQVINGSEYSFIHACLNELSWNDGQSMFPIEIITLMMDYVIYPMWFYDILVSVSESWHYRSRYVSVANDLRVKFVQAKNDCKIQGWFSISYPEYVADILRRMGTEVCNDPVALRMMDLRVQTIPVDSARYCSASHGSGCYSFDTKVAAEHFMNQYYTKDDLYEEWCRMAILRKCLLKSRRARSQVRKRAEAKLDQRKQKRPRYDVSSTSIVTQPWYVWNNGFL